MDSATGHGERPKESQARVSRFGFAKYSGEASRAMLSARAIISERGGQRITDLHLLYGLAEGARGVLAGLLPEGPSAVDVVAERALRELPTGEAPSESVEVPFTHELDSILTRASTLANDMKSESVRAEHFVDCHSRCRVGQGVRPASRVRCDARNN